MKYREQKEAKLLIGRVIFWISICLMGFLIAGCSAGAAAQEEETTNAQEATAQEETGAKTESANRPNIIFLLADDMDYAPTAQLPTVRSELIEKGASFDNALISDSLCCPSRATILTGLYAHNHGVTSNNPPDGGFEKFVSEGHEKDNIATRLQQGGYETGLYGKYLNHYPGMNDPTRIPPGWNEWHAWEDTAKSTGGGKNSRAQGDKESNAQYYGYKLNEDGKIVSYGKSSEDYMTDVLSKGATDFVHRATSGSKPFFLYLAPTAPHGPPTPPERHKGAFAGEKAPRPPSFDEEDVSDKPAWIRDLSHFSDREASKIDKLYRSRMESMLAVDDMLDALIKELEADGQLDNTFIFFTSDNGFLLGEHRIKNDKRYPYEESVRTPLYVRGPGVPAGSKIDKLVANTDFAPTFADLAGTSLSQADGRSFAPLLAGENPPWRSSVLLEWFETKNKNRVLPAFEGIRTEKYKYIEYDSGDKELYDVEADPYEQDNLYETADSSLVEDLKTKLDALRRCTGDGCKEAEGP